MRFAYNQEKYIQGCEEDEYALNDGSESRRSDESLPVMTTLNGPWSHKMNGQNKSK